MSVLPHLFDEAGINVERMNMAVSSDPIRDLDGGVTWTAPEIRDDLAAMDVGWLIERGRRIRP
ncbi:MAG: hypothetical protein ACTSX7_03990 [Alphaproteobacteria bacterium]